jgi:glycosyltransferase involved in cell wall biosynthesis
MAPPLLNVSEDDLRASVPTGGMSLAYCGELRTAKGVMVLLEAFEALVHRRTELPFTLRIIGSGYAEAEMRAYLTAHRLSDRVEFVGQIRDREELARQLRRSLAVVLPSFSEGFPRVAYECFTLGVPILLTPVGGIPYLVRDREHTLFIAAGEPEDIATKILMLHDDAALRARLVAAGRQLMREHVFPIIARYGSLARMVEAGVRGEL